MTTNNNVSQTFRSASLIKRMLAGAGIGFFLITAFLVSAGEGKPEWGHFWMIRPMLMLPFAGAVGGAFYYFITRRFPNGAGGAIATVFGILVFIFGLWIGTVLGLDGTYWN